MTYLELARKIKSAYKELKQDEVYKLFNIIWNNDLGESEITVENDAGFRAIIIGNTTAPDGSMHSLSGNTRLQRWQNCLPDPGRDMTWQKTWGLPIRVLT